MRRTCQLIFALDFPEKPEALDFLKPLAGELDWVKIGLQLFTRYGPAVVEEVADLGYRIFLDLKLHDIPNTVAGAVSSLVHIPVSLLTLHASGGSEMLKYAVNARDAGAGSMRLLAVTVMTSLDAETLRAIGFPHNTEGQVRKLAALAKKAGIDGCVCSPQEAEALRHDLGPGALLVTPGVRPAGSPADDQKRVLSPAEAAAAGATHIVVGRPIRNSSDPVAAVRRIKAELATAPEPE